MTKKVKCGSRKYFVVTAVNVVSQTERSAAHERDIYRN